MLADLLLRLKSVLFRGSVERDMDDELRFDLEQRIEAFRRTGLTEDEARRQAALAFGGVEQIKDDIRDSRGVGVIDDLQRDIQYAFRTLRRAPGFTLTAIVSLALGIGGTTAAFTLLDHVLLRPLPYPQPERLAGLYQTQFSRGYARLFLSWPNYQDWKRLNHTFAAMGAYGNMAANVSGHGEPRRVDGVAESDLFQVLGVRPRIGRALGADDEREAAPPVVVLSDGLSRSLFATPDDALGQIVRIDDQPYAIVGVMPPAFGFPAPTTQFWLPAHRQLMDYDDRSDIYLGVVGRLRAGASLGEAQADVTTIANQLEHAYPKDNPGTGAVVVDLRDVISPQSRMLVLAVFGAAFCLLLIACTNLASLLLGRSLARRRELAVRVAIGAGRARLVRQLVTEHAVLAFAGGIGGVGLAVLAIPLLAQLVPTALPVATAPRVDGRVLLFAALATVFTTLAIGVATAWRSTAATDAAALQQRAGGARVGRDRMRAALVLAEIVGTVTLLVGCGLLTRALWRVESVDPGFKPDGVLTLRTALPFNAYRGVSSRAPFYDRVLADVRSTPGVVSAAYTSWLPMVFGGGIFPATRAGEATDPRSAVLTSIRFVSRDYFATLGIPVTRGRDLSDGDASGAPFVTVISESLARRLWPGEDPIGRTINIAFADRTVVGVVRDIAVRGFERPSEPQVYAPEQQMRDNLLLFHIPKDLAIKARDDAAALALAPAVTKILHAVAPDQPVSDVQLLSHIMETQTTARRTQVDVLGLFAAVAFLLAAIGIHGMLSFAASTRKQEVGVRLAIGATRADILSMFLRQGLVLGVLGTAMGAPLAYALGRMLSGLLFGVSPADGAVYLAAMAIALVMTISGSLHPAMEAARLNPVSTMRAD